MNRQPFQTPPHWWSPRPSTFWIRLWRPYRRRRGFRQHGLCDIQVRGLEHLATAAAEDQGVLITPNHSSHADPFVLLEAADQVDSPFYFMTAWQVFGMTHRVGRQVLRQHGCFSINREGHDVKAVRCAIDVLATQQQPLVIFPEGEVFHLNDRLMPFRRGAATAALLAAKRGQRRVACVPCAIKFQFVNDPTPNLLLLVAKLEEHLLRKQHTAMALDQRIYGLIEAIVSRRELVHLGTPQRGELNGRITHLIGRLLGQLEDRFQLNTSTRSTPERVKRLRFHVIQHQEVRAASAEQRAQCRQDLDVLFEVMQLYSYPIDYLAEDPTLERLAETLDKLEEDVLGVRTAGIRGQRKAIVSFGAPIIVLPEMAQRGASESLTRQLECAVETLLDQQSVNPQPSTPAPCTTVLPAFETGVSAGFPVPAY